MAGWTKTAQLAAQPEKGRPLAFSAWVEVNLSALEHNLRLLQKLSAVPILPILKGDAYGHGAPVVAAFLRSRGCSTIAVSTVEEALDILAWTKPQIMLLTPPLPDQLPAVVEHSLTPTITSPHLVGELNRLAAKGQRRLSVQVKVDTGFGRLGVAPQDFLSVVELIANASHLKLGGVFTHFSAAAWDRRFTRKQLQTFLALREQFQTHTQAPNVLWHAANSAAFLTLPQSHLDLVRLGTLLYGQAPLPLPPGYSLQETWRFRARIIHTRWLPPGHSVGYGRAYRTTRPTRIGVIPVGYGHGLDLEPQSSPWRQVRHAVAKVLCPRPTVLHGGEPLPILGRPGMGLCCLDLTQSRLDVGDVVTLHTRRTVVGRQVPRLYYLHGRLLCTFWNGQVLNLQGRTISLKGLF